MAKTIVKELIIILLLSLAIILIMGVILYEYMPMGKTIPSPVSYVTPESVKQELAIDPEAESNNVILTYEIDETDLSNYRAINNYNPGKSNPFSSFEADQTQGNATNSNSGSGTNAGNTSGNSSATNSNGSSSSNGNNSSTNSTNNSDGQFFQNKGTK